MVWGLGFWVSGFRFRGGGLGFKVSRLSLGELTVQSSYKLTYCNCLNNRVLGHIIP